jgi:rod shape-determining protein MreD
MNAYLTFVILGVLALLQSTVLPRITVLGVHPDVMLMVVTAWSLLRGSEEGMLWALIGGLTLDLLSSAPFGVCTLPLLLVSFLCGLSQRGVFRFDLLIPILVIPAATLVYGSTILILLKLLGWPATWGESLQHIILPSMLVNTLCMPFVYVLMRLVHTRTWHERIAW